MRRRGTGRQPSLYSTSPPGPTAARPDAMSLPVVPIHDPVAHPDAGADLSAAEVAELEAEIRELARERDAVILAHNYQLPEVQAVADHVGDSLQLAIVGKQVAQRTIVFCGVHFMAESAAVLAPEKRVLLPNLSAGCSLADSITAESLEDWKARYPDHAVVTYVNSSAEVKALSDICCTSANAASVVRSLPQRKILFTPTGTWGTGWRPRSRRRRSWSTTAAARSTTCSGPPASRRCSATSPRR